MEFVPQKRRQAAPDSPAQSGGKHHDNDVPLAERGFAEQRGNAARNGARDQLPFRTDIPDVGLEADDETHRAKKERRHLDADFRPAAKAVQRRDEEDAERTDGILTERGEKTEPREHSERKRDQGGNP